MNQSRISRVALLCALNGALLPAGAAPDSLQHAWVADQGNGKYRNPVLQADYSDPDVIRVEDTYFMTSSSFSNVPGLPLLQSKDMVNWELVGHALPRLVPEQDFTTPQPGKGVWAPCLRFHSGKFWRRWGCSASRSDRPQRAERLWTSTISGLGGNAAKCRPAKEFAV